MRRIYSRNTDRVLAVVLALGALLLYLRAVAPGQRAALIAGGDELSLDSTIRLTEQ